MPSLLACLLLSLTLCACSTPDLGIAPFLCNPGYPPCPEGYQCVTSGGRDICLREGANADLGVASGDGKPADGRRDGVKLDGTVHPPDSQVPRPDRPGGPVQVIVTEFMANPAASLDADGEWLELFNPGNAPVDINGWTLKDNGQDSHTIASSGPLVVPARAYLLLGRSRDKALNGGVNVAYAYSAFFLANTEDEVILLDAQNKLIDSFSYSPVKGFTIPNGASLSVKHPAADRNLAASWCAEPSAWPGSKGDKGTPGLNPNCK
jgi:hypothetical protein